MSLAITEGATVTYADPSASFSAAAGKYWLECGVTYPEAERQLVGAPGVDGQAISRSSDAFAEIEALVAYISAAGNADGGYAADLQAMQNVKLTVTTPQSGAFTACEFAGVEEIDKTLKPTGWGTYMKVVRIRWKQLRDDA